MISVGGSNIVETLCFLGITFLLVVAIACWIIARGRQRGSTTIALDTTFWLSSWSGAIAMLFAIIRFGAAFVDDQVTITTNQVALDPPAALPCGHHTEGDQTGDGPWLECISSAATRVSLAGVPLGLTMIATLTPLALIAIICWETARGRTFDLVVIRSLWVAAGITLIAGVAGTALTPFAEYLALKDIGAEFAPQSIQTSISLIPVAGALLYAAFAAIFRHGARLQRDTEGLV
jgi:hypothetical protein